MFIKTCAIWITLLASLSLVAQEELTFEEQLAQIEAELNSATIFNLIDSILLLESVASSEINIRFGYNSSVVASGRDFGIDQQSFSPGISFYHKKGIFADLTGFINSQSTPQYNLTMLTLGYMGFLGKRFSYTGTAETWFYNLSEADTSQALSNSLSGSLSYNLGVLYSTIDYSYLIGNRDAHRVIGSVGAQINLGKLLFVDKISILPSVNALAGNQNITQYRFSESERTSRFLRLITADPDQLHRLVRRGRLTTGQAQRLLALQEEIATGTLSPENEQRLIANIYNLMENDEFGLMNLSFSLPVSLNLNQFNLMLSYTYSIPIALPSEEISLDPIGYFGANLTYRLSLR